MERIIRSRAPLRISFAGGGTDIKEYFENNNGGIVVNATIGKYAYTTLMERNDYIAHIKEPIFNIDYKIDLNTGQIDGSESPFFTAIMKAFNPNKGFTLISHIDTEYGSGLGSSSTVVVSVVGAFTKYLNTVMDEYESADLAYKIEREDLKIPGGMQDQYAAVFGGFNFIEFSRDRIIVNRMRIRNEIINELQFRLLLVNLNIKRKSNNIINKQINNLSNEEILDHYDDIKRVAIEIKNRLYSGDMSDFGDLLREEWNHKKLLSADISNEEIENFFQFCEGNGAKGYKLLGAGGGGYALLYTDENHRHELMKSLKEKNYEVSNVEFVNSGLEVWEAGRNSRVH